MIITKTQLLSWANEGFPEYYRMVSTQRYLTMIPELLEQANHRFERYALEVSRA